MLYQGRQQGVKQLGGNHMTKEIAIQLLKGKDVYLTAEGKKMLLAIVHNKKAVTSLVSSNS